MMDHRRVSRVALSLENFSLVMREAEVVTAAVNVKLLLEMVQRHRRALDVPSRATGPPRRIPSRLSGFCCLPQGEVLVVPLSGPRFVHAPTSARSDGIDGLAGELSVLVRSRFNMEVHAIIGFVGMTFVDEVLRDANHVVNVFRTARVDIRSQDVEGVHVLVVGLDVGIDQSLPITIKFVCTMDDFVIDIGEILHVMNVVSA